MAYTGQQKLLQARAQQYTSLGYKVGLTLGKGLIGEYTDPSTSLWSGLKAFGVSEPNKDFDGISLMLDGLVCVDFDKPDLNIGWYYLPPTLKERTPHGYHLFYLIPSDNICKLNTKIKWQPYVDLLTKEESTAKRRNYKNDPLPWSAHALCSPTHGYTRVYPEEIPQKIKLAMAPDWLMEVLSK